MYDNAPEYLVQKHNVFIANDILKKESVSQLKATLNTYQILITLTNIHLMPTACVLREAARHLAAALQTRRSARHPRTPRPSSSRRTPSSSHRQTRTTSLWRHSRIHP